MKKILDTVDSVNGTARVMQIDDGPVYAEYCAEVTADEWELVRWYSSDEFDENEALQFSAKVLNNPSYREACLNGNTNWVIMQELMQNAQSKIIQLFEESGILSHRPSNFEGEQKAEWAAIKLREIVQETYFTLYNSIRIYELDPKNLYKYLEAQYEATSAFISILNNEDSAAIGELRPSHQYLVFPPDDDPYWESESIDLSFPVIVDVYVEEYGPVAAITLPPQLSDIIKELDWDDTHRQWQSERELWEIDLDATDQLIDLFNQREYKIKVPRPIVEIIDASPPEWPDSTRVNYHRPLMKQDKYAELPSGTDLLRLPGVGRSRARWLLQHGYGSMPELAHSSIEVIAEAPNIREAVAETIKQGAQIVLNEIDHPSVHIVQHTDLLISEAEKQIARLASKGIPPTEAANFIIESHGSELSEIDPIDITTLYFLYEEGITTQDAVGNLSFGELTDINYITDSQAEDILSEL